MKWNAAAASVDYYRFRDLRRIYATTMLLHLTLRKPLPQPLDTLQADLLGREYEDDSKHGRVNLSKIHSLL